MHQLEDFYLQVESTSIGVIAGTPGESFLFAKQPGVRFLTAKPTRLFSGWKISLPEFACSDADTVICAAPLAAYLNALSVAVNVLKAGAENAMKPTLARYENGA